MLTLVRQFGSRATKVLRVCADFNEGRLTNSVINHIIFIANTNLIVEYLHNSHQTNNIFLL